MTTSVALPAETAPESVRVYPPISALTRTHVTTAEAAFYLNRRTQTLRVWACREAGSIRPVRVMGRLAWPVDEIRRVLELPQ